MAETRRKFDQDFKTAIVSPLAAIWLTRSMPGTVRHAAHPAGNHGHVSS